MQLNKRILMMVSAVAIGLSMGWLLPAYQAPAKNWKDRAEYDLYDAFTKGKDGKAKLEALDKWKTAYPDSEFKSDREEAILGVYQADLKDNRRTFDQAKAMRATNPNNFYAISAILTGIYQFTPLPPAAGDMATAEETSKYVIDNADKIFAAANKPANLTDAQWTQVQPGVKSLAQRTYAWLFVQRKDDARAEQELTKVVSADPAQPSFSYMLGQAKFSQYQKSKDLTKLPGAIFHIARAASYDGTGALAQASRTAYLKSAETIYKQYHGSDEGWQGVIALAKANAMPPADFKIRSITEIEQEKFANQEEWDKAHPMESFWRDTVKTPLTGADADNAFANNYKGAGLPPAGQAFQMFKAKIISMTPETNPKELTVAVFDPNVADAKLTFDPALPGMMPVGETIEFKGEVTAFQKEPFMVTFKVDMEEKELVGWTGVAAKGAAKGKAATKGAAKGAAKGKAK